LLKFTETQNAVYARASKRAKRVLIAQDVLAALRSKRLRPTTGTYLDLGATIWPLNEKITADPLGSFQELLPQLPPCNVCAKGAIFACTVLRQNEVKNQDVRYRNSGSAFSDKNMSKLLQGVFSPAQLRSIETEFECRRISGKGRYAVMGLQRFQPRRRIVEIMQNIVRNQGTFKPKPALKSQQLSHEKQNEDRF
jgi:hypothetical protein